MPHLSPMKWKLMALTILFLITMTSVSSWWSQLPSFPSHTSLPSTKPFSFSPWQWN